jgi:hypothetical protein
MALKSIAGEPIARSERGIFQQRSAQLLASLTSSASGVLRLAAR